MPRAAAIDILERVLAKSRPLDEAQADALKRLKGRDRALAANLAMTALRHLGETDALIEAFVEKPIPAKARRVHDVLRIGIVQLLYLRIPDHAAVAATVDLVKGTNLAGYKGLVNAVLRRVAQEGAQLLEDLDAPRLNTAPWLWESWVAAYGEDKARAIARAHMDEPPLDLCVKEDAPGWASKLDAKLMPTGALRLVEHKPVTELEGYAEGRWWVQDMAAQLPALLLGEVRGRRVIDLCCAPGGKTMELAAMDARVTAVDRSENRLKTVKQNLQRTRMQAELVCADAVTWRPAKPADALLLDAPCSATGTIRRHPDAQHIKAPGDVAKLAGLQQNLLQAAVQMVAPGGTVVYCTCSLQPEEGEAQIAALLGSGAPVELVPVTLAEVGGMAELLTKEGYLRTLPCHLSGEGGMDGFFAARLRRT